MIRSQLRPLKSTSKSIAIKRRNYEKLNQVFNISQDLLITELRQSSKFINSNFLKFYDTIAASYRRQAVNARNKMDQIREDKKDFYDELEKIRTDPVLSVEQRQLKALKAIHPQKLPPLHADTRH